MQLSVFAPGTNSGPSLFLADSIMAEVVTPPLVARGPAYDGERERERRNIASDADAVSLSLSPSRADGGRLPRQTLLSCSSSSTLHPCVAFFRGFEPDSITFTFPSIKEHHDGQSLRIVWSLGRRARQHILLLFGVVAAYVCMRKFVP